MIAKHKRRTDAERRVRQGERLMRFIRVHRMSRRLGPLPLPMAKVDRIAKALKVCQRTIYRDLNVLQQLYDDLKSKRLD